MSNIFTAGGQVVSIYPTPESMQSKVDEYFEWCFAVRINPKTGFEQVYEKHTPTYAGLARYLGFSTRQQLLSYADERDERYTYVVQGAKLRLEEYLEGKLVYARNPAGIALSLKNNAGWEEKSTRQISGADDAPLVIGWAAHSQDVIDVSAADAKKEGTLPPPAPEIESTSRCAAEGEEVFLDGDD